MLTAPKRVLTFLAIALLLVAGSAAPAAAEPGEDGGQNLTVRQALDKALGEYNDAKGRLDKSVADQNAVTAELAKTQARLVELQDSAGVVANAAYRGRRVSMLNVMLGADNPDDMMHNMVTVEYLLQRDNK